MNSKQSLETSAKDPFTGFGSCAIIMIIMSNILTNNRRDLLTFDLFNILNETQYPVISSSAGFKLLAVTYKSASPKIGSSVIRLFFFNFLYTIKEGCIS